MAFTLLTIVISCQKEDAAELLVIDAQAAKVSTHNLSEVFEETEQIALGVTMPLINYVRKVIKTRDFLFISDPNPTLGGARILQFDREGNFIKQIGNIGYGPGEYTTLTDFAIDTFSQRIYIAAYRQLISYDYNGTYIGSSPTNVEQANPFFIVHLACVNEQLWSVEQKFMPSKVVSDNLEFVTDIITYSNHMLAIDTLIYLHTLLYDRSITLNTGCYSLSNLHEGTYIYCPITFYEPLLRDTLYQILDLKAIAALRLDFSDVLTVNSSIDRTNMTPQEWLDTRYEIRNVTIKNLYRTSRYLFAEYNIKSDQCLFCYDFDKDLRYNMKDGFADDLFGTGIAEIKPLDLQGGEFYYVRNGYEVEGIVNGVNESSNPVIFIIKTKE